MPRFVVGFLYYFLIWPDISLAQIPEIPDISLPDIAMTIPAPNTPMGAVIIYNPIHCAQVGAACEFFRAHEYGHVMLGHQFTDPGSYAMEKERDADRYAATHASMGANCAAYYLFMSGGSSLNFPVYGLPVQRAERLRQFAMQAGTWNCRP